MNFHITKAIILFVLVMPVLVVAQENFNPGYFIDLKGDIIKGTIDYPNVGKSRDFFNFKFADGNERRFFPLDVKGFYVAGELYYTAITDVEVSPEKVDELDWDPRFNLVPDTVFLQTIVGGKKGLFRYIDNNTGKSLFYIQNGNDFDLLLYKTYYSANQSGSGSSLPGIATNNKYIGQLNLYLEGCPELRQKMGNVHYNWQSLKKLFDDFYTCTSLMKTYDIKDSRKEQDNKAIAGGGKFEYSLFAGLNITFIQFSSTKVVYDFLSKTNFTTSIYPSAGFAFDIVFPRIKSRLSLNNELMFTGFRTHGTYKPEGIEYYNEYNSELGGTYLKLNILLGYRFLIKKSVIYLNAGPSSGLMLTKINSVEMVHYSNSNSEDEVRIEKAVESMSNVEIGVMAGAGIRIHHISCEFRYDWTTGINTGIDYADSKMTRFYVLLGYKF
jgi:hypothetical protein